MHTGLYVFPCSSEQKSHTNNSEMQNVHVASRPKFHVLSNEELVFAVSPILCTEKWNIYGNCACIQPAFSACI
jgi:hypothetical protein